MKTLPEHTLLRSAGLDAFFDESHEALVQRLQEIAPQLEDAAEQSPTDLARELGARHGLYRYLVPETVGGAAVGRPDAVDVRALVLIRETLGYHSPLADALFAVQGLGAYPIAMAGSAAQKDALADLIDGTRIAAFALTEPEAGSDVASLRMEAHRDNGDSILDGEKTFISNVPIADSHVVFANADPSRGKDGITAFIVDRGTPGLHLEPQPMSIQHPIGTMRLIACRIPESAMLGQPGAGLRLALSTLETFRISVGAAACGMAAAALDEAVLHVERRVQFGKPLAEQQIIQGYLADMATELDAARLLVARAAYLKDRTGARLPAEVAMAKMYATEAAQRIIDRAVQLHGGRGVQRGTRVEALYREIRPLRIYEGTTEIQKLIIARSLLR